MKRIACNGAALLLFVQALLTPALAGIADSPLPVLLAGETTYHLYSVPGVISSGGLETYFSCTSTDTAPVQVCVEVFPSFGGPPTSNDCSLTSLSVAPGGTVLFGTNAAFWVTVDSPLGGSTSKASARIVATSKKLACTAWVADLANAPPTSAWQLTIIKQKKQKGD